jgi:2,3,4,5-tetrahydropyridine-2-carboxylate N-succinyltransferase
MMLEQIIERLYAHPADTLDHDDALSAVNQLKDLLNTGEVRAAEPYSGTWRVNAWVKQGILLAFRIGVVTEQAMGGFTFFDKNTIPLKKLGLDDRVRIVPGGTAVRDGAYVAPGVVMMPPSYVNIGAYVDEHTMIDSHALVGSCAQIGRRVHLSAAAQIGGVLEPIGSMPVVIEDDVFVGGNTGVYEGTIVGRRAVIGAGVILTGSTPVYDIVRKQVYRKSAQGPLVIPEGAVVVPGSRRLEGAFADEHRLSLTAPVIIKYRDERTDAATVLEESLR